VRRSGLLFRSLGRLLPPGSPTFQHALRPAIGEVTSLLVDALQGPAGKWEGEALASLIRHFGRDPEVATAAAKLIEACGTILTTAGDPGPMAVQALRVIDGVTFHCPAHSALEEAILARRAALEDAILRLPPSPPPLRALSLVGPFFEARWRCLARLKRLESLHPDAVGSGAPGGGAAAEALMEEVLSALDTCDSRSVPFILCHLRWALAPYALACGRDEEGIRRRVDRVLTVAWDVLAEERFRPSLTAMVIDAAFCPELMAVPCLNDKAEAPLRAFFAKILAMGLECRRHLAVNLVARCVIVPAAVRSRQSLLSGFVTMMAPLLCTPPGGDFCEVMW
jgi:hypothetical protein